MNFAFLLMSVFMLDVDGSRESSNILTIPLFTDGIFLDKFSTILLVTSVLSYC